MITTEFINRLGNNMFQIAVTYAIAEKYNETAEFPPFQYFNLPKRTRTVKHHFIQEIGPNDVIPIPNLPDLCIIGWFQRHEYFDSIREKLITHVFKIPQSPLKDTIGIQIRRGDYLKDPVHFPTQPDTYYLDGLKEIGYKGKKIIFCSDDIPFCIEHFGHLPNVQFNANTSSIQDIECMANCESLIISNSTMGFWGAYLGSQERKIIYPHNWFGTHTERNGSEICLPNWIKR